MPLSTSCPPRPHLPGARPRRSRHHWAWNNLGWSAAVFFREGRWQRFLCLRFLLVREWEGTKIKQPRFTVHKNHVRHVIQSGLPTVYCNQHFETTEKIVLLGLTSTFSIFQSHVCKPSCGWSQQWSGKHLGELWHAGARFGCTCARQNMVTQVLLFAIPKKTSQTWQRKRC